MNLLAAIGRVEESYLEVERAFELDPHSMIIGTARGWARYYARDFDSAVRYHPPADRVRAGLLHRACVDLRRLRRAGRARSCAGGGDARRSADRARPVVSHGHGARTRRTGPNFRGRGHPLRDARPRGPALRVGLRPGPRHGGDRQTEHRRSISSSARTRTAANMLVLLRVDPRWDRIRSHPRFQDIERRMAFPPVPAAPSAPGLRAAQSR
jgi:hypothetical protein